MAKLYIATQQAPPFRKPGERGRFFTPTQKSNVYDAIYAVGADGISRKDIAVRVSLAPDRISFYLSDLQRAGYITSKSEPTSGVNVNMTGEEARFAALLGLETAFICTVNELPRDAQGEPIAPPELMRGWIKYGKIKELALRPGTGPEGKSALRMATIELVRVLY